MAQLYVGNLTYTTLESELRSLFERHGRVNSVRLAIDRRPGKARGFAFVTMPRIEDAEEAAARLNGMYLAGRPLTVNAARSPDKPAPSANRLAALAILDRM